MKKRLLSCALLGALGMAQSAMAQDFDDRWYVTGGAGVGFFDRDRHVSDELYGTLGFGKFVTRNISIDAELWHSDPDLSYGAIPASAIDSSSSAGPCSGRWRSAAAREGSAHSRSSGPRRSSR